MLGSLRKSDGCEPDKSDFDEATMPRSEIKGPCVSAEDCIRDEGKPFVDAGWGEDRYEDRGGVGVDPRAGVSATTVLGAEAAHVRLERHAHQAVG